MAESKSLIEQIESDLVVEEAKAEKKNQGKEKGKYIFIGILLCLCFVGLAVMVGFRYLPKMQYNEAIKLVEEEKYKEATSKLNKISEYGNASFLLESIYTHHPQYNLLNAEIGTLVTYGTYNQTDNISPIEWNVLAKSDDKVLLLSKHIIDAKPYTDEDNASFSLTQWLNGTFKDTAFGKAESKSIAEVFLLNREQVESYVEGKEFAASAPTKYALDQDGYNEDYSGDYVWWTSEASSSRHYVIKPGGYSSSHVQEDTSVEGIRPAIWVSLE